MTEAIIYRHYHSEVELQRMTPEQRRDLAGKLARQQRSRDETHRRHAEQLLAMIREADAATVDRRVSDARTFLYGDGADQDVQRRVDDARKFLRR